LNRGLSRAVAGGMILALVLGLPACRQADSPPSAETSVELFSGRRLPHLVIEIPAEELKVLENSERNAGGTFSRPDVTATVREGAAVYRQVGLHLKGSKGSFRALEGKPAFTLHFDSFMAGQRFHGLEKISLNNSVQDPSLLCEQLGREAFRAAGVPVPRATHATVEFNGRPLGVFVLLEGWNKQFLKRHFRDAGGNFYEADPGQDITGNLVVKSGDHPQDRSALDRLVAAVQEPDLTQRWTALQQALDVDQFISGMAVESLIGHWDGYVRNRNNYRVFHDRVSDRLVFMPHGMDQLYALRRVKRWNPQLLPMARGLVATAILETEEGRSRYLRRMADLNGSIIDWHALSNHLTETSARLQPLLAADPATLTEQRSTAARLYERIPQWSESFRQQLARMTNSTRSADPGKKTAAGAGLGGVTPPSGNDRRRGG
jgi:spore coat protein H